MVRECIHIDLNQGLSSLPQRCQRTHDEFSPLDLHGWITPYS
jgi:hypothetical protein